MRFIFQSLLQNSYRFTSRSSDDVMFNDDVMLNMAAAAGKSLSQESTTARENSEILIVGIDNGDDCIVVDGDKGKGPAKGKHYKRKNCIRPSPVVIQDLTGSPPSHESRSEPSTTIIIEDGLGELIQKKKKSNQNSIATCDPIVSHVLGPSITNSPSKSTITSTPNLTSVSPPTNNHVDPDYEFALQLYKELNKETSPYQSSDEALARKLQEDEYAAEALRQASKEGPDVHVVKTTKVVPKSHSSLQNETDCPKGVKNDLSTTTSASTEHRGSTTRLSNEALASSVTPSLKSRVHQPSSAVETSITGSSVASSVHTLPHNSPAHDSTAAGKYALPPTWTRCPNCPTGVIRRYHLIDVVAGSEEWLYLSNPLTARNFLVTRVQRIQNAALWQRFQSEQQLMMHDRPAGFDVNERLLYHTSKAEKTVICEEGLDQRLSRAGNFGTGIYFSDDPQKCNAYWAGSRDLQIMFGCRVLLGDIKVYPHGHSDAGLRREPLKTSPRPDESKTYDSVRGNVSGHNEFVVYNTYRVMPEYVLEYTCGGGASTSARSGPRVKAARKHTSTLAHAQFMVQQAAVQRGHRHGMVAGCGLPNFTLPSLTSASAAAVPTAGAASAAPVPASCPSTGSISAAPLPIPPGSCQLCWGDPATCKCGLNSKKQCKYCRNPPTKCTCPTYKRASGEEIPYRCLPPINQGLVRWQQRKQAASSRWSGAGSSNQK